MSDYTTVLNRVLNLETQFASFLAGTIAVNSMTGAQRKIIDLSLTLNALIGGLCIKNYISMRKFEKEIKSKLEKHSQILRNSRP